MSATKATAVKTKTTAAKTKTTTTTKPKAKPKAKAKTKATLKIRQIRSGIGFDETQKGTLRALGLEKIGRVREYPDNPAIRGMAAKISHLVVIEKD